MHFSCLEKMGVASPYIRELLHIITRLTLRCKVTAQLMQSGCRRRSDWYQFSCQSTLNDIDLRTVRISSYETKCMASPHLAHLLCIIISLMKCCPEATRLQIRWRCLCEWPSNNQPTNAQDDIQMSLVDISFCDIKGIPTLFKVKTLHFIIRLIRLSHITVRLFQIRCPGLHDWRRVNYQCLDVHIGKWRCGTIVKVLVV